MFFSIHGVLMAAQKEVNQERAAITPLEFGDCEEQ